MEPTTLAEKPSLTLRRSFPVPPERVWRAWTDPQALKRWFGPGGEEQVSVADLDVRNGGRFRIVFGGADGKAHEVQGVYREVVPHRKLVFTWTWPNSTPERESVITIEFRAAGGGTELVFRQEQFFDAAVRDNHRRGWTEAFVKLEKSLTEGVTA